MNGAAGWGVSWSAVAVAGACGVLLHHMDRHGRHIPDALHPWLHRVIIAGMYVAGCAIALTPLGSAVISAEGWLTGLASGPASGALRDIAVVAGLFLFGSIAIGFIWVPAGQVAWMALALPFVAALSGGHLHGIVTAFPVIAWVQDISAWIGGR